MLLFIKYDMFFMHPFCLDIPFYGKNTNNRVVLKRCRVSAPDVAYERDDCSCPDVSMHHVLVRWAILENFMDPFHQDC